jgi:hypothetical protein
MITYGKGRTGDSHPIMNDQGGAWAAPSQVREFLSQSMVNLRCNFFSFDSLI